MTFLGGLEIVDWHKKHPLNILRCGWDMMGKDLVDNTLFIVHIDILTYMVYQDLGSIKDEYVEILRNCMNI